MNKRIWVAVFALTVATTSYGEQLTLHSALTTARKNNSFIIESNHTVEAVKAKTGVVRSAWLPQINLVADWNKGRSFLTAVGSVKETEVSTAGLQFRQTLYDFGRTEKLVASQQAYEHVALQNQHITSQDVELQVRLAYLQALTARSQARVANSAKMLRQQLYEQACQFYQQGIRPKIDVLHAETNLHSAAAVVIKAETAVRLADLELARAMGQRDLDNKEPVVTPSLLEPLPTLEQALETGLQQRSEIIKNRYEQLAATEQAHAARSGHLPYLSLTATAGLADKNLFPDKGVWNIGGTITIPVFSGFGISSQVKEAQAVQRIAVARGRTLYLRVAGEIETAWRAVQEVDSRYVSTVKAKETADEQAQIALERYRQGVGSIIEASDAQVQAYTAENEHLVTDFERLTARMLLARALGQLGAVGIEEELHNAEK